MIHLTAEFLCPRCNSIVSLGEFDRLLECVQCRSRTLILPDPFFQYYLPPVAAAGRENIYIPFWHLRGSVYKVIQNSDRTFSIQTQYLDSIQSAIRSVRFFDPFGKDTLKKPLKPVKPGIQGSFVCPEISVPDVRSEHSQSVTGSGVSGRIVYHDLITEAVSLIYFPVYVKNETIHNGISDRILSEDAAIGLREKLEKHTPVSEWKAQPLHCPQCGRDLRNTNRAPLFHCEHCEIHLVLYRDTLTRCTLEWSSGWGGGLVFMPFWQLILELRGIEEIIHTNRNSRSLRWTDDLETSVTTALNVPAFRVHPAVFLQSAEAISKCSGCWNSEPGMPPAARCLPADISVNEAVKILPLLVWRLASMPEIFNSIRDRSIHVREIRMAYIPFRKQKKKWIQTHSNFEIPMSALINPCNSVH
ncbi:MAG TPA: hypothetical protein ENN03_05270 [bacterium]|nr:hypothetical protein [bacterium]